MLLSLLLLCVIILVRSKDPRQESPIEAETEGPGQVLRIVGFSRTVASLGDEWIDDRVVPICHVASWMAKLLLPRHGFGRIFLEASTAVRNVTPVFQTLDSYWGNAESLAVDSTLSSSLVGASNGFFEQGTASTMWDALFCVRLITSGW